MYVVLRYSADHLAMIDAEPNQSAPASKFASPAVARSLEGPFAWTVAKDGVVLACAGFAEKWLDHWMGWAYMSRHSGPHMLGLVRAALQTKSRWPRGRIEASTPCDFAVGHKLLELLGFSKEAERMRRYTPDGRDHALYAFVNGELT